MREELGAAGNAYLTARQSVMDAHKVGLTHAYNLLDDSSVASPEVSRWRERVVDLDVAVQASYSWHEIKLGHGFHLTDQGIQFTISPQAGTELLNKLSELNHYRYEQELRHPLHSGKGRRTSRRKGRARAPAGAVPVYEDGGLFAAEGTLF